MGSGCGGWLAQVLADHGGAEVASGKYCRASSCLFMALELFFCKCLNINFSGGYGGILYNLYK